MWRTVLLRLRALVHRGAVEQELDDELRFHVERQTEAYIQAGMTPEEARRRARLEFGGVEQIKEGCREARGVALIETLLQDLRYGIRVLAKSPGFTAVAVLSLGLGIGANTVMFSLLDQAILRALPVKDPDGLVAFRSFGPNPGMDRDSGMKMSFSYPKYLDFRDRNTVFSGVIARFATPGSLSYRGQAERVDIELVSGNYFEVLGVQPAIGRLFRQDDDRHPGAHPVAVLSYEYWVRRFGADPSILGQTGIINDCPMTVVGVSAPGFSGVQRGSSFDVRIPMMMKDVLTPTWRGLSNRYWAWLNVMARLKPGVGREQAETGINVLYRQILQDEAKELHGAWAAQREEFLKRRLELLPAGKGIRRWSYERSATAMVALMAMVGVVLLIACLNLANLLMARTAMRQRELAIRLALGAGRGRVARQLMVESLLLAAAGGTLGLLIAGWAGRPVLTLLFSEEAPRIFSTAPDLRVLTFTACVSLLTAALFGLAPAFQPARTALPEALKTEAGASAGAGQVRFRKALVTLQVGFCLWLLIGAGLFARTLYNLKNLDLGFRRENLITFSVDPSLSGYSPGKSNDLCQRLEERLAAVPGVRSAALSDYAVLKGGINIMRFDIDGYEPKTPDETDVPTVAVTPGYLSALGLRLVAGRDFTRGDGSPPRVAIVNQSFARQFFGNRNPVGKHLRYVFESRQAMEIIGVVRDVKYMSLRQAPRPFVYVPYGYFGEVAYYVRTEQRPESLIAGIRKAVQEEVPGVPIYGLRTMEAQVNQALDNERLIATLSGFFGLLATLLAAVGLYGVMAYTVARRTREIGIRVALGAMRSSVVSMVMKEVAVMIALGLGIGLPSAFALTRLVESQLYGVTPTDPPTVVAATLAVAVVAALAGLLPARRAARVDPVVALRYE